jgi:hypothetical protein
MEPEIWNTGSGGINFLVSLSEKVTVMRKGLVALWPTFFELAGDIEVFDHWRQWLEGRRDGPNWAI